MKPTLRTITANNKSVQKGFRAVLLRSGVDSEGIRSRFSDKADQPQLFKKSMMNRFKT